MVIKGPPLRIRDESYNALLNYGFGRHRKSKQDRRRNITYGYSSAEFLQEHIQPKMTSDDARNPVFDGVNFHSLRAGAKKRSTQLNSGCIQQQTIQPSRTTIWGRNERGQDFHLNETKKRQRPLRVQPEPKIPNETTNELRIEGDTISDILNQIRIIGSNVGAEKNSVFFKGIRNKSHIFIEMENEHGMEKESLLLLNSLKDLVQRKGSYWKRIRIEECSPLILEILLKSLDCHNFEEIHLVGIRDDDEYGTNHDNSNLTQTESQEEFKCQSLAPTSSLIVSLLREATVIRDLVLKDCNLDNFDLIRVMDILSSRPNSLERLDLRFNKFTSTAIQSILDNHLRSSLHSLKCLKLRQGVRCVVHRKIRDAVLGSLRCNRVVLESIDVFEWDKSVQYLLDINRAKRRFIFCNNDRFPRTLWPLLLEQAFAANEGDGYDVVARKAKSTPVSSVFGHRRTCMSGTRRQASVIYHMFRNGGPMLLEQQHPNKHHAHFE